MFIQTVKEEFDFNIFKTKKHKIFASFEYLGMHTNYMNEFKNSFAECSCYYFIFRILQNYSIISLKI